MNLRGKTITLLGSHGFIGSSLATEIKRRGGKITTTPTKDSVAVLHFASYTHLPFEQNPAYHTHEIISSFLHLLPFCETYDIPFIYPSSALVYEQPRPFYHLKKVLEEMQYIYKVRSRALRIFPVYGVGEGERGHPTAIQQWVKQMFKGERPIVYGDGTQSRDFIYISDVVDSILDCIDIKDQGVKDIGAGKLLTFNDIIEVINDELATVLKPKYIKTPKGYTKGILCPNPVKTKVDIHEGIRRMIEELT